MSEYKFNNLSPFKFFILETFPFIQQEYFDAMNEWQLFCKVGEKINEIINSQNSVGQETEALYNAYIQLKDYIDNLDLQDEVNNKLNDMTKSGELAEIINQELLASINQQIANIQTQQGQMSTNISNIETNLAGNIEKTNTNETQINNLNQTKADNSDLVNFVNNTNRAINNQYEIIGRLQGGTPVVVSDISAMTDTSKIYVLTTNGQWYYYNGSSFVSGGTYQATDFGNDTIDSNAIKRLDYSKIECVPLIEELTTTTWNGATVPYHSKNNIQINTENKTETDAGVFIMNLNDIDKTRDLFLFANCSGVNFNVYLYNGTSTFIKSLFSARNENPNKDVYYKIKSSDILNVENPKILIATSESGNIYVSNVTLTYYDNFEYRLKNLITKINETSPYYNNIKQNTMETNILDWEQQGFGSGVKVMAQNSRTFNFRQNGTFGDSRGITSPLLNRTDKKLIIECDVENVSQEQLNFNFYIAKSNSEFFGIGGNSRVDENGHYKAVVDMPYYAVYEDYNEYYVWLMSSIPGYINFTNFKFYYSDITETSIYAENFNDIIKNIDSKISSSSTIKSDVSYIQAPNNKYFMQANDNGNLQLIDVIPSKTLFIGNSLLLGNHHGDYAFGMCASNINNDYYYHITQYILNRKSNATFDKISGTAFESATTQNAVSDFLNNTLLPKLNNDLQLVIVQLGDNVNTSEKVTMFNSSCLQLLQFIRLHAPNSRVVFVGEWYSSAQRQTIISNACKNSGCQFVDISMLNTTENQSSIGTVITYPDGYTETVSSSGVASHPRKYRLSKNRKQNYFRNILKKERSKPLFLYIYIVYSIISNFFVIMPYSNTFSSSIIYDF